MNFYYEVCNPLTGLQEQFETFEPAKQASVEYEKYLFELLGSKCKVTALVSTTAGGFLQVLVDDTGAPIIPEEFLADIESNNGD